MSRVESRDSRFEIRKVVGGVDAGNGQTSFDDLKDPKDQRSKGRKKNR